MSIEHKLQKFLLFVTVFILRREPSHGDIQEQDDIQGRLAAARRRATAKKVRSDDEVLQKAEYFSKVNDTKVEIVKEEQEKRNVIDRNIQLKVGKQEKLPTQRDDTEDKAAHEKQKIEIGQPEHSNASKGIGFIPPASTSSTVSALKHRGLMRRFPSTSNANDVQNVRRRHLDERSPEVHFIGEIVGGLGFGRGSAISCLWKIEWGVSWKILEGKSEGQTQYSSSPLDEPLSVWNHPVDVHMACSAIEGWPRITMEVWKLDDYGRTSLEGYGFTHLPSNPGKLC